MPITFSCSCGKTLQVAESAAGKKARCPKCGAVVQVPEAETGIVSPELVPEPRPRSAPPPLPQDADEEAYDLEPEEVGSRDRKGRTTQPQEEAPRLANPGVLPDANHAGQQLDPRLHFFADPPMELGSLFSADSTLKEGVRPMEPALRWGVIVASSVGGLAVAGGIGLIVNAKDPIVLAFILGSIGALLGFLVSFFATRFSHRCTYVGKEGLASYSCSGSLDNVKEQLFFFADAVELRIAQTRHYTNGAYTGTDYVFTWSDRGGREAFKIAGTHKSEQGDPPPNDYFRFALAAEGAWSAYLARNLDLIMGRDESLYFGLDGRDYVRVGNDFVELSLKDNTGRLSADDIDYVQIKDGMVSIWERGGKRGWFSKKGIHDFPFASLGNARFFLFAVDRILGVPIR